MNRRFAPAGHKFRLSRQAAQLSFIWIRLSIAAILLTLGRPGIALETYIGGFGTASLSCFSSDTADYVINDQPEGPGRTRHCDAGLDSTLGVQLDLGLSESVDFGLQIVAGRNVERNFKPDVTLAQLRWRPTDALTLRLGRMPSSAFLHAENRQVRYAMPWVRPPLEVYGLVPAFSQDGLEIINEGSFGRWQTEWHGGITRIAFDVAASNSRETFPIEANGAFLNLTLRDRNTQIKLGYGYSKTSFTSADAEALFGALSALVFPDGAQLADDLAIDQAATHLFGLGMSHEQNDWLAMAEFGFRSIEGFFRDQYGAYVTLGKRFGPWMPYSTLAWRWTRGPDSDSRAGFLQPQVDVVLASSRYDTSSLALGLSREITEQATLKFQADWIQPDKNSWGLYYNHAPDYDYANPDSDWLFTLSLDFIF
ncbi:hypothetical protein DJ031_16270 [bacterium endosymbiont of Escarpia laminata]|nr:MAG: hypothetical protein DJ031_16270 [bacterium endosymbiont of Escarpia laminata]